MTPLEASEKVLDAVVKSGVDFCPFYYCFEKRVASREMVAVGVQVSFVEEWHSSGIDHM